MIKKIYYISGFDCPNCAAKAEAHINRNKNISYCRLDFSANRMYITYKDSPFSLDELKALIAEVEDDPLDIRESDGSIQKDNKVFDKNMWILLGRIIFAIVAVVYSAIFLRDNSLTTHWINFALYLVIAVVLIYDLTWKVIMHIFHRENIVDHNLLITISCVGAFILASLEEPGEKMLGVFPEFFEAVMVVLLFQIGHMIEIIATNRSKTAIMSAVQLRVDYANKITENGVINIKPEQLDINDKIIVKSGELIPTDGEIIEGEAFIDSSSLTGEFVPVKGVVGSQVFGGCLIKSGTITVKVNKKYSDSTVAKIVDLIAKGGESKSKADEFIAKFAKYYTPIVIGLALLVFVIFSLISIWNSDYSIETAIHTALEIIVTGCPCAIVISIPLAYFSAIGLASKNGIVVKGASYLDKLVTMGKLITDKTGTLTHGSFNIQSIHTNGISEEEFMEYLLAVESLSTHPIGKAICHGKNVKKLANEVKNFEEIAGLGVIGSFKGHDVLAGNAKLLESKSINLEAAKENGTAIYLAIDNKYSGYVILSDELKEDAQPMVDLLHSEDVEIILLTGDKEENAKEICNKLGIDRWHSNLLPEQKTDILVAEMVTSKNKSTAFIGDGINDAPSIIRSDIGIAMGGIGSDIAVENADIVIMNDDPAKVYDAMRIAKMARNTAIFNLIFALSIKFFVMVSDILNLFNNAKIQMILSVVADTGLTVILVINSLLLLYRKVKRKIK